MHQRKIHSTRMLCWNSKNVFYTSINCIFRALSRLNRPNTRVLSTCSSKSHMKPRMMQPSRSMHDILKVLRHSKVWPIFMVIFLKSEWIGTEERKCAPTAFLQSNSMQLFIQYNENLPSSLSYSTRNWSFRELSSRRMLVSGHTRCTHFLSQIYEDSNCQRVAMSCKVHGIFH